MNTVLDKVVAVLFAFRAEDHGLTLTELCRRTGLAKGTVHRVVGASSTCGCWIGSTAGTC